MNSDGWCDIIHLLWKEGKFIMRTQDKIAVLIDAENVSKKYIKLIMDEVNEYGTPTYKRVYGDFSNPSVSSWKDVLRTYALTPVIQFNYVKGKNASDSAMIIDAMDILYSGNVNGFCLVTSDSDFTKLANRLREAGMLVIGMGEQKTPTSLVAACEQFKYLDLLFAEEEEEGEFIECAELEVIDEQVIENEIQEDVDLTESQVVTNEETEEFCEISLIPTKEKIGDEIRLIIEQKSDEAGWINQSEIGVLLSKRVLGFDPRNYNFKKLSQLIESYEFLETKTVQNPKNELLKIVYVKIK